MAWIGVDLDATLAKYIHGQLAIIGEPIKLMQARVLKWLADGQEVRIMTARASLKSYGGNQEMMDEQLEMIREWCKLHLGQELPITAEKDFEMIELWDDRAIQIIPNTGKRADGNL